MFDCDVHVWVEYYNIGNSLTLNLNNVSINGCLGLGRDDWFDKTETAVYYALGFSYEFIKNSRLVFEFTNGDALLEDLASEGLLSGALQFHSKSNKFSIAFGAILVIENLNSHGTAIYPYLKFTLILK